MVAMQLLDDDRRRARRRENAVPLRRIEPGHGRLGDRRHVGQQRRTPRRFDLVVGLDSRREGVMLRTGRNIPIVAQPSNMVRVDWLSGAAMSYRRTLLEREPPDEVRFPFEGEDADLSFRIGKHAQLVVLPTARARHLESQTNRVAGVEQAEAELRARLMRVAQHPNRLSMRAARAAACPASPPAPRTGTAPRACPGPAGTSRAGYSRPCRAS